MSVPTIIAGPAVVQFDSRTYYTEGDITVSLQRETFNVVSSLFGTIDTRLASQMAEIRFKPVGALDTVAKYMPYAASQVGQMLINQASPKTVTIWAKDGTKTVWGSGFISALPTFTLSPRTTAIGEMTLTCLGDPTKDATDAAAWNAITTAALSDATFDETKILTPQYLAEWGEDFVDLESIDGFTFVPALSLSPKRLANYGVVNYLLSDLIVTCRFSPGNLTEAEIWELLALQDTGAKQIGQSLSTANDLVITGGGVTFTLPKAGPTSAVTQYGLEPLRQGEVAFVNRKTWTTGVLQAPFSIAFA